MNRYKAFAYHLLISLLIFAALAAVIKFFWYPSVLFDIDGGWEGIKLIASVDLIMGPLLTLIVFNPLKKELKRDLFIIALLQFSCIAAGMVAVHHVRPVAVVYHDGVFETLGAGDYQGHDVVIDDVALLQESWPVWIAIKQPDDAGQRQAVAAAWQLFGGAAYATDLYVPYAQAQPQLNREGLSVAEAVNSGILPSPKLQPSMRVFKINARYGSFFVSVDPASGRLIQVLAASDAK